MKQKQKPSPESSEEDRDSTVTACTGNDAIRTVLNNIHQLINKHVSDGIRAENEPKTAKTKEAKDFNKSEAELVDVMDTFQRTISIIEKEIGKNPTFLQRKSTHGTRTTPR